VLLEEVRRRNRRRIAALAGLAGINYWLVLSLVLGWFGWGVVFKVNAQADIDGGVIAWTSLAAGAVAAYVYVALRLARPGRTTLARLGVREGGPGELQRVENLVEELSIAAGASRPRIALLADPAPNALTVGTGSRDTTIVVTSGLVEALTRDELEAVLAVQICAIRRLDVALQTVVVACAGGAIAVHRSFREDWKDPRAWLGIAVTWPTMVVARFVRRYAFRACDFGADDMAIRLTRHPEGLQRALTKLLADTRDVSVLSADTAPLWFEPVPMGVDRDAHLARYAMTPGLKDRIARLQPGARR
jgi:heat shock protein HtpX